MTYGQLKLRLTQMFPGVSLDPLEGWAGDRYSEILGELPWSRLDATAILETVAPYVTGTVAVTAGSAAIALTGGTWISSMTGRAVRVAGDNAFYSFSYSSATTGLLDRPYEGTTATAAAYSIYQSVYPLPADCRLLADNAFGRMVRFPQAHLNESDPLRVATGTPTVWTSYMDDLSTPPNMQVEIWPAPSEAIGIPYTYSADAGDLASTATILQ